MKKILLTLLVSLIVSPLFVSAHAGDSVDKDQPGFMMMQQIEDKSLNNNDALHEEMEELMKKMMNGNLSEQESDKIAEFMKEFPGTGSMMLGRLANGGGCHAESITNDNYHTMMGFEHGGFFGGGIIMVFFWALVLLAIVLVIKYLVKNETTSGESNKALEILKERYAKGEIDKAEFDSKIKDLT
jgi:putative membrane protein